ncbi:hypothetical protein M378DRAFT_160311 [Amanita muscaria Koide BX008]|uniref:Uncharacterized protein n=1 Tax=Amanita muscaria (strain Koide BX008) TaxID=946122 RepID=A0A0C2XD91_AMAMK|nr:hypothetical protein M378DRAFT_160311 [Amanita muscaria Koide BX008]
MNVSVRITRDPVSPRWMMSYCIIRLDLVPTVQASWSTDLHDNPAGSLYYRLPWSAAWKLTATIVNHAEDNSRVQTHPMPAWELTTPCSYLAVEELPVKLSYCV